MWFTLALAFLPQAVDKAAPNRIDLGAAYMRFERALARHPLREDRVAEVNRAFDALTVDFFMGNGGAAIEKLSTLTRSLAPDLKSLRELEVFDAEFVLTPPADPAGMLEATFRIGTSDGLPACDSVTLTFRALCPDGRKPYAASAGTTSSSQGGRSVRASFDYSVIRDAYDSGLGCPPIEDPNPDPLYLASWRASGCDDTMMLPYAFLETPGLAARRDEVARLLSQVEPDGPPLEQALASCRARATLLTAEAHKTSTYLIGRNVHALAAEVHREAHALTGGTDPYRRLRGDTWRVVRLGKSDVPVRVFAPRTGDLDQPSPLLVLFHGMGGDENMFFDGYGAGHIKELAEERHFVCVAPRGGFAPMTAESFDVLVRAMLFDYAIDPKRVYVLGHSMGAGAAFDLAASRSDRIAAAACIAGGSLGGEMRSLPPLLVVAGELDSLVAAKPLVARAERLARAGFSVEVRTAPNQGHTLVVGATLPAVVAWLLSHTR